MSLPCEIWTDLDFIVLFSKDYSDFTWTDIKNRITLFYPRDGKFTIYINWTKEIIQTLI